MKRKINPVWGLVTLALALLTVALCILLLVLPSLAMPIFPSGDDGAENRYLADYPTLADEDGLNPDFDDDFEAWLRDHFALRQQAVRANAQLNYSLLRTSPNGQVIVGDGDWLYFDETVADYTGDGRFTDEELALLSGNLSALADALAERGARLYIAIVPNKNTVYPQYMPGRYAMRADEGNLPLLREACADIDAQWIDLVEPLEAAAAQPQKKQGSWAWALPFGIAAFVLFALLIAVEWADWLALRHV